jgi:hypothetical protein
MQDHNNRTTHHKLIILIVVVVDDLLEANVFFNEFLIAKESTELKCSEYNSME